MGKAEAMASAQTRRGRIVSDLVGSESLLPRSVGGRKSRFRVRHLLKSWG